MERKINYYLKSLDEIDSIKEEYKDRKPTLLLHSCCGPCSCFPLTFLCPIFDVTILYNNSNIYLDRKKENIDELIKQCKQYITTNPQLQCKKLSRYNKIKKDIYEILKEYNII